MRIAPNFEFFSTSQVLEWWVCDATLDWLYFVLLPPKLGQWNQHRINMPESFLVNVYSGWLCQNKIPQSGAFTEQKCKAGVTVYTNYPSTGKAGGLMHVQYQTGLNTRLQANQSSVGRPCVKRVKKEISHMREMVLSCWFLSLSSCCVESCLPPMS